MRYVCACSGAVRRGLDRQLEMFLKSRITAIFRRPPDSPELLRSQFRAFSKQLPLLYFILTTNTAAIAYTHWLTAPLWLGVMVPSIMCGFNVLRVLIWLRRRGRQYSDEEMAQRLRGTFWLAGVMSAVSTSWGLALYPYGDIYARCHVIFAMAITGIGCIICLMNMRGTAALVAASGLLPVAIFLACTGNTILIVMALNIVLFVMALIVVLSLYYRDFAHLIASQAALRDQQRETQALSNENFRLATVDSLTSLPNRRYFFAKLDRMIEEKHEKHGRFAVGVLDMDGFKQANDHFGHATGDRVLEEVGKRLCALSGPHVLIARLGGDEFGLLLSEYSDEMLMRVAESVCKALQMPYVFADATIRLSSSIGLALFPDAGTTASLLFERADYALYFAKEQRRGTSVMFSDEHETEIKRVNDIEVALRQANFWQEMSVAFQPIFDVQVQRIVSFEGLARWNSPVLGAVSPADFIQVAERSDLIHELTRVLLTKTLTAASAWPADIRVSFNLSALDLTDPDALGDVMDVVRRSGMATERIDFEITESALISDYQEAHAALTTLKALGMRISLDDFGTGYSSLSYLHRLPLNKIKIDRSFIAQLESERAGQDIVKSIVSLCRHLDLVCIVEGVETASQAKILRTLGCRFMQGYLFGKPMSPQAVLSVIAAMQRPIEQPVAPLSER